MPKKSKTYESKSAMDICRICLGSKPEKNISELNFTTKEDLETCTDILSFCLDIQYNSNSTFPKKLCKKCYKTILLIYDFKTTALRNDAYLRAINNQKLEVSVTDCQDSNDFSDSDNVVVKPEPEPEPEPEVKIELDVKEEDEVSVHYQSDDEFLSVLKKIKSDKSHEDTCEKEVVDEIVAEPLVLKKRKRGRPKVIKEKKRDFCEECGKSVWDLKLHSNIHKPKEERKKYNCKHCSKTFCTYAARNRHDKIKHLGIKKHCNICNKDVVCLWSHMRNTHQQAKLRHRCSVCDHGFLSKSLLNIHMMVHTKEKPFACDVCEKKFRLKATMMQHKRQVHELEKSHLCQFCSASFFKKYHLQIHLRKHTKEKPHKCEECGKFFATTSILHNHRLIHSTVKEFQCPHCDSAFIRASYLKNHLISHTKEKKHPCKYCGVKFGRSDHRKRHEFTAHEKLLQLPPTPAE